MKIRLFRDCGVVKAIAFAAMVVVASVAGAQEKKNYISLSTDLGHDFDDALALAFIIAHTDFELKMATPAGENTHGTSRILKRFHWLVGAADPLQYPSPVPPSAGQVPDPSGMFQFGLRPFRAKPPEAGDSSDGKFTATTLINLAGKSPEDEPKMPIHSLYRLFDTGTPLAHALHSLYELSSLELPSLAGARKVAAVGGVKLTEDELIELVAAYKAHNDVPDRVLNPVRNQSHPVESGAFPPRVHAIENYQTDIERHRWLSGKAIETNEGQFYCEGRLTRNFDGKMGDPARLYRAVIFNPVPGPPMGPNTRLKFEYYLEGADWLQCQIYTLSKGYHRYTTIENLPGGDWHTVVVDLTKARRPDGSGGALSADERIDDIQFYTDPKALLLIDNIVLYDAAAEESDEDSFPKEIIFTGWFDTGKQGEEWPGDFQIVPHQKPRTWKAAKSVIDPETGEPWIRVGLRGLRPAGGGFRVKFEYRLRGSGPIRVSGVNAKVPFEQLRIMEEPEIGSWTTAEIKLELPVDTISAIWKRPQLEEMIEEVRFRVPKGSVLEIDNLMIYR